MQVFCQKFVAFNLLVGLVAVALNTLGCGLDSPEAERLRGELVVKPSTVTFGVTALGDTTERTLTLSNWGEGSLRLEVELVGDEEAYQDGAFYLVGERPDFFEIEAGQDLEVIIAFSPLESRSYEGIVRIINSDDRSQVYRTPMRTGAARPELFVYSPVIFPAVAVGSFVSTSVEIPNIGYAPLIVENVVISGEEFSIADVDPFMVAPDESEIVMIDFAPISHQPVTGEMTIFSNDLHSSEFSVSLEGNQ